MPREPHPGAADPTLTRRWCRHLALIYALLMSYGSLVPFDFHSLPPRELARQFWDVITTPEPMVSRSDALANVLLGVPLGFLLLGAAAAGRRGGSLWIVPIALVCTLYGAGIECAQFLFPPRECSRNDILAQGLGATVGTVGWLTFGRQFSKTLANLVASPGPAPAQARNLSALALYVLVILALEAIPFDFTLNPVEIVHKWREGRIHLVPFAAFTDPLRQMGTKTLTIFFLFLPAGLLLGAVGKGARISSSRWSVLAFGLLLAGGVELVQLLVLSRHFEPTDIFTGTIAVWFGWRCERLWQPHTGSPRVPWRQVLFILWLGAYLTSAWTPFDFTVDGAAGRWAETTLIPFVDHQQQHYLYAFDGVLHKILLFIPCGLLISAEPQRRRSAWLAVAFGVAVAAAGEAGQVFLPERTASVSDVVLAAIGSLAGRGLAWRLSAGESRTNERAAVT